MITRRYRVDSLARRRFVELVGSADAALTNVEAPFNDFHGPPAHGIGIHLSTSRAMARQLQEVGFNLFAAANNHALDYGIEGLRRHVAVMRELAMAHAGVGEDAREAASPAYLETPHGRVALIACASSLGAGWPAADAATGIEARPGVNALRFATAYTLDPTRFAALRDVADALGLGEHERYELDMGYVLALPDPAPATRLFGGVVSEAEEAGVTSVSDPADLIRITTAVTQARTSADLVIVYLHTQEYEQDVSRPAAFTRAFAKACVDAGAHVVAASGPHVVRGVERYDGAPILHGLGNLWFQYDQLERLPPDSLTAYGLPPTATPGDFSRTAMLGFRRDHRYWESAVARCNFEGGRLRQLTLHPVTSGYGQAVDRRGAPEIAGPDDAARILTEIADLSAELGAHVRVHDGLGHLALDDR